MSAKNIHAEMAVRIKSNMLSIPPAACTMPPMVLTPSKQDIRNLVAFLSAPNM